jgi:diaminohydroxyphosphoribosylaminopyrimidine deaminase/5-amino-6-(5-phosphoribosylamino)uracil reductase
VTPEAFMRLALAEAVLGRGRTHPNPIVGAVVVKGSRIVARGHHALAGLPHAEVNALRAAGAKAKGADLYVTLEPCNHHGRTPPCTQTIIEAGVKRVFFGSRDPNPNVGGGGRKRLQKSGVEVQQVLGDECDAANEAWLKFITTGLPWVVLKAAVTLDGKLATSTGDSKWISSATSRATVHDWRNQMDAVLVGAGTARKDDPLLTVRDTPGGRNPVRIVLGSLSPRAKMRREPGETLVLQGPLKQVLKTIAARGLTSVLVEGGASVHGAFLRENLWDELRLFIAPRIAGANALSWAGFKGPASMRDAPNATLVSVQPSGNEDVLLLLRPARPAKR